MHDSIKRYLTPMTSFQIVDFYQLVQAAMKIERLEYSSATRGRRQRSNEAPSTGRGASVG